MTCNICGNDQYGSGYCEKNDCHICEDCIPYNIKVENKALCYCNSYGCDEECEYKEECGVIDKFYQLERERKEDNLKDEIYNKTVKYFKDRDIECIESIGQTDRGTESVIEFLEELYCLISK